MTDFLRSDRFARYAAAFTVVFAVFAALPAFLIWLGLPAEGDAVDYRVSLVKWLVEHRSLPDWKFTFVDDYPVLGELLLAVFYSIHRNLMRLVPVLGYIGLAFFSAKILAETEIFPRFSKVTVVLLGMAWVLALRPVALQSNLLMIDNLTSCFLVAALYFSIRREWSRAGILLGIAFACRYSAWVVAPAFAALGWYLGKGAERWKNVLRLTTISFIGAVPTLWRNWTLNRNPFYPMFDSFFNGTPVDIAYFIYGRGRDLISFLLLPYDMLFTNSFRQAYFDYTLGKLFYVQLAVWLVVILWKRPAWRSFSTKAKALCLFGFLFTVCWFLGSQQMRFFVPVLVVINLAMLAAILRRANAVSVAMLTLLGLLSIVSVQRDSMMIAMGKRPMAFSAEVNRAQDCLAQVPASETIGFFRRDGVLGFLDRPFRFFPPHAYLAPGYGNNFEGINFLYTSETFPGFAPWPNDRPCLQKRLEYGSVPGDKGRRT